MIMSLMLISRVILRTCSCNHGNLISYPIKTTRYLMTNSLYRDKIGLNESTKKEKTFQELLDESPLVQFGRAPGKCVIGKITEICNDDLYIDFGGKFEAVVKRPANKTELYEKDSKVRLILNKFEMTGAFLGDKRHITLCEADAVLIGPYFDVVKQN